MTINEYLFKEIKRLMRKYNIIIRHNSEIEKYYVYTKGGKLEFTADSMEELIYTCHLYYD